MDTLSILNIFKQVVAVLTIPWLIRFPNLYFNESACQEMNHISIFNYIRVVSFEKGTANSL